MNFLSLDDGVSKWVVLTALLAGSCINASCSAQSGTNRQARNNGDATQSQVNPDGVQNSGDWARFRGPTGMGISNADELPLEWTADDHIKWKAPLSGAGASSPVVFGDRIYLTSYTGYHVPGEPGGSLNDLKRHLICLGRDDGQVVWDQAVPATLPEEEQIRDHGFAANSPVVDGERVYVFFGKSGVLAFDHQGHRLWKTDVGSNTHGWGTGASPILYHDLVLVNASVESESLVALDKTTGDEVWRAGGIRESWNTPLVVRNPSGMDELVVAIQGQVLGLNPQTGKQLWSCETDITWYMVPSAVAADGIVYFLGGRSGTAALAVRTGGNGDVTSTHRLWTSNKGSNVTSPVLHKDHLYWAHEKLGIAYCALAATGKVVYEQRLNRAGQVYASALLANGRVYYLTREGRMFVVSAQPKFELLATNDLQDGGQFNASPAVAGSDLLLRSDKFLYCIQP